MKHYRVNKLLVGKSEQLDQLSLAASELYSRTVISFWRTVRHQDIWLKPLSMMRWHNSDKLHAHSADAVVQSFYASLDSWRQRRKQGAIEARPPRRRRRFYKIQWKSTGIRLINGRLILSNGRGNEPLIIDWRWEKPKLVEVGWNKHHQEYEVRACYVVEASSAIEPGVVAGIDLGEVHSAVAHDGMRTDIINGRLLRSKRRHQNTVKGKLSKLIDTKKRGSRRRKRLIKSKQKQLARIKNQIKDIQHKQTSHLVSMLKSRGIQTLVIGDVRNIRTRIDYGAKANQKLHQWSHGEFRHMLTYKAQLQGMKVELINEAYTSQTCPHCRKRHKPKGRKYKCQCGFRFHRDGVGAINIRKKYQGDESPVVGVMASPIGVRFHPHLQSSSPSRNAR